MILELDLYYGKIRHDIKILFFNKKRIFITFSLASKFFQSIKPAQTYVGG